MCIYHRPTYLPTDTCLYLYLPTDLPTYTYRYIHMYIHTYLHTYLGAYAHVYVSEHVRTVHLYMCIRVYMYTCNTGIRVSICLSVCLSACLPACLPARLPVCLSAWLSVCRSVGPLHVSTYVCVHVNVCMYVYVYAYAYIYIECINTYVYIYATPPPPQNLPRSLLRPYPEHIKFQKRHVKYCLILLVYNDINPLKPQIIMLSIASHPLSTTT